MVSLVEREDGYVAYPIGKGSGSVTAFAQADGFFAVDALADRLPAGTRACPSRSSRPHVRVPDLVITGSHGIGLDAVIGRLARQGFSARVIGGRQPRRACGSADAANATSRRSISWTRAPASTTGPTSRPASNCVEGWRRMQGIVFRTGDERFEGRVAGSRRSARPLADPGCLMVNRNQGAGTRILIDQPPRRRAAGRLLEPAALAQCRRRGGRAGAGRLGCRHRSRWRGPTVSASFRSADEHYDFALVAERRNRPAVAAFLDALTDPEIQEALRTPRLRSRATDPFAMI